MTTRRLIASCWKEEVPLDRHLFELRLERAKKILKGYRFRLMFEDDQCAVFSVEGGMDPYLVFLDKASRRGGHYCSCPDGARRVMCPAYAGSLCKHLIAIILEEKRAHLLLPVLASLNVDRGSRQLSMKWFLPMAS